MKTIKKALALGIGALMSVGILTGCAPDDLALYNALNKTQKVTSSITTTDMSFNLSAKNLSTEEEEFVKNIIPVINSSKISMTSKIEQNADKTKVKAESTVKVNMAQNPMDTTVWVDTDLTGDKPKFKEIIKVPSTFTQGIPKFEGKQYLVMDYEDLATVPGVGQVNTAQVMKFNKDLQEKFVDFMNKYVVQFNPKKDIVKNLGTQDIIQNGVTEKATIYQIKLNDQDLKELIRYTANNAAQNKDAISFVKEYMIANISMAGLPEEEFAAAKAEIDKLFIEYNNNLPEILKKINEALDEFNDIKVLGDAGIDIKYAVNSEGYIINQKGYSEFVLDLGLMSKLQNGVGNETQKLTGVYTIGLTYNSDITNINKPVTINFPEINESNSVKYSDLIKIDNPLPEEPVIKTGWVLENGKWYYKDNKGQNKKGWLLDKEKWYYLDETGEMKTGWVKVSNKWYYLNKGGDMAKGWVHLDNKWYYLKDSGDMATGWLKLGNNWYYLRDGGDMATGWIKLNSKWYYLKEGGDMATGWIQLGNKWYYLYSGGDMAVNTYIGKYKIGADGAWVK